MTRYRLAYCSFLVFGICRIATAAENPVKPEEAVEYRQSVYNVIGWHWSPMAAMVQKKRDFNADEFIQHATIVEFLSPLPIHGFMPETKAQSGTKARKEIWENWADFEQKMNDMNSKSRELLTAAKTKDEKAIRRAFLSAAKSCKVCHDEYRER
jgi:cytochrome c556